MAILFHRRENKKKESKGAGRKLVVWLTAALLLASASFLYLNWRRVTWLTFYVSDSLLSRSYFSVREIKVKGGEKVGGSQIVAMAGLNHGMNLWRIDPRNIERKVGGNPWVKRVLVRREFPRRVVVEVEERAAKGIVVLDKLYYVDAEGFVFKEVRDGDSVDYPLLTGLHQEDLASQSQSIRQKIQEALRLSDLMAKRPLAVSEINFRSREELVLYPMFYPMAIHMGWGDWEEKLLRLERVLTLWQGKEDRLAVLELSFRDQVVARIRKG